MKKLFYLLLLLPFSLLVSCDKEELKPFDLTLTLGGVTQVDGTFYAVAGDNVTIEGLNVNPTGGKETAVANVMFYVDAVPLFPNPWDACNGITFSTQNLRLGLNKVGITGNLLQVGQPLSEFASSFSLIVVENEDELPAGAPAIGSYSATISYTK